MLGKIILILLAVLAVLIAFTLWRVHRHPRMGDQMLDNAVRLNDRFHRVRDMNSENKPDENRD